MKDQRRFVSITFDDGLLQGARRAIRLLDQFGAKATFYLVTGWVRPNHRKIRDQWNSGRDHGSWADWQEIEESGHEIGSHTVSHLDLTSRKARWVPMLVRWELQTSYDDLKRNLQKPPVSMAVPFDASTPASERLVSQIYQAARIGTRNQEVIYNDLARINWFRLRSWGPFSEMSVEEICQNIARTPDNHWIILQFHSLDDEGWMPISSKKFEAILQFIAADETLRQVSVRDMVEAYKRSPVGGSQEA